MKPATMSSSIGLKEFRDWFFALHKLTAQQVDHNHREKQIEDRENHEGNSNLAHRRDRFLRPHHAVNDPGLTAKLGHDPTRLDRKESERSRCDQRVKKPFAVRNSALFPGKPARRDG